MSKTITISDESYNRLKELATEEKRTLNMQFEVVLDNYSASRSMQPTTTPTSASTFIPVDQAPLPVLPPNVATKVTPSVSQPVEEEADKYWYKSDPEYIELNKQVKEIDEQMESGELDEEGMALRIKERQYIVSRINEIRLSKSML